MDMGEREKEKGRSLSAYTVNFRKFKLSRPARVRWIVDEKCYRSSPLFVGYWSVTVEPEEAFISVERNGRMYKVFQTQATD